MDRRERYSNPSEIFRLAVQENQTLIWTALPGIIAKFPGSAGGAMTVDVQPTINGLEIDTRGNKSWVQMPVLLDCPIAWQGGGGVTATFPIALGDECLVVFSSRCIDAWWKQGGIQNQAELRMHNLSDGFALVGLRSLPRSFTPDPANACLITDDGQTYFKLNPTSKQVAVQASGGINLNGVTIDSSGNINSPATITATTDVVGGGKHLKTHVHTDPQGGNTGPPV